MDLMAEIASLHEFLNTQKRILDDDGWAAVLRNQKVFLIGRIKAANVQLKDAAAVSEKLQQGPWSKQDLQDMASALSGSFGPDSCKRRPNQTVMTFAPFLSAQDLQVLRSQASRSSKIEAIVNRCINLRIHLPSEAAIQEIVGTSVALGIEASDGDSRFETLQEFKRQLRQRVKSLPTSQKLMEHFPDGPAGLPDDIFAANYQTDPPAGLAKAGDLPKIPLRRNSLSLTPQRQIQSASSAATPQQLMQMMMQFMQNAGGGGAGLPGLQINPGSSGRRGQKRALQDDAALTGHPADVGSNSPEAERQPATSARPPAAPECPPPSNLPLPLPAAPAGGNAAMTPSPDMSLTMPWERKTQEAATEKDMHAVLDALDNRETMKKPAASGKMKTEQCTKAKAKTNAKGKDKIKSSTRPCMPKPGAGTVFYKQGKVHRSDTKKAFRVFVTVGDRLDRPVSFKTKPEKEAWSQALDLFDEAAE